MIDESDQSTQRAPSPIKLAPSASLRSRLLSQRSLFVIGTAVVYAPWLFLGYGQDDDAYRLIRTGRVLIEQGQYIGSRNPGYLIPELGMLPLNLLGGSFATNFASLTLGLLTVWAFWGILLRLGVRQPLPVALCLVVLPLFWLNATSSMDYVWAMGFVLAGWLAVIDDRSLLAGVLMGLAIGSRFTSVIAVFGICAYLLWTAREKRPIALSLSSALLVGAMCYLPSAAEYGWTLGFLEPSGLGSEEKWTWALRIGRWGYKNIYIWGLPSMILLAGLVVVAVRRWKGRWTPLGILVLGIVLAHEALFLLFPLDPAYLLPAAVFVLLGLGLALSDKAKWLGALAALIFLSGLVSVNLARPDTAFAATHATLGVWIQPGPLVEGTRRRLLLRHCKSVACWHERLGVPIELAP